MVMVVVMVNVKIQSWVPVSGGATAVSSEWVLRTIIYEQEAHAQQVPNQASTYVTMQNKIQEEEKYKKCKIQKLFCASYPHTTRPPLVSLRQQMFLTNTNSRKHKKQVIWLLVKFCSGISSHCSTYKDWCQSSHQKSKVKYSLIRVIQFNCFAIPEPMIVDICKWLPWLQRHTHTSVESPEYWGPPSLAGTTLIANQ